MAMHLLRAASICAVALFPLSVLGQQPSSDRPIESGFRQPGATLTVQTSPVLPSDQPATGRTPTPGPGVRSPAPTPGGSQPAGPANSLSQLAGAADLPLLPGIDSRNVPKLLEELRCG